MASTYDPEVNPVVQRFREILERAATTPERPPNVQQQAHNRTREAIRQLSRSRVGEILRQLRAAHGISYEQVQTRTGLSQQLLYDVEYRERRLTIDELRLLAHCYEVSMSDVLGIEIE